MEAENQAVRVLVKVRHDRMGLDLWAPTLGGYALGFGCVRAWPEVRLRRAASLEAIPHKVESDPERIDKSFPTRESVSVFFGDPDWNGEPISCTMEYLMSSDMSSLLPTSKRHMPIYMAHGELVVAMWDPLAGSIVMMKDLTLSERASCQQSFDMTIKKQLSAV